ncbi:hypothetical protein [Lactococcus cremoris]|uniref:hypothetical protein n=1 Tax=Lactococcus lactis subsp. cremoris TaxID=1359 RepID=UPI0021823D35|nr:hypothetical protein [Lactococcus cremoris]UXV64877.2 hypothetical protein LLNCDO700_07630 [Lactococcus cremoris]
MEKLKNLWDNKLWFKILVIVVILALSYWFGIIAILLGMILFIYAIVTVIRKYILKKNTRFKARYILLSFLALTIMGGYGYAQTHPEEMEQSRIRQQDAKAKKAEDAKKVAEAKKSADAKKAEDAKKAAEAKKSADAKKAEDAKKAAEAKKSADAKKAEDAKKVAEAKKAADAKKAEDAKKVAEAKKAADAKKAEDAKKAAEAKKAADAKKAEDAKKAAEAKKSAKAKKAEDAKNAAEAKKATEESNFYSAMTSAAQTVNNNLGSTAIDSIDKGSIYPVLDVQLNIIFASYTNMEIKSLVQTLNESLVQIAINNGQTHPQIKYYISGVSIGENRSILNPSEVKFNSNLK